MHEYLFQFATVAQAREVLFENSAEHCTIIEHNPKYDLEGNSLNAGLHNSAWAVIYSSVKNDDLYALAVLEKIYQGGEASITRSKLGAGVEVSVGTFIEML